jgi:hypothetical protein
MGSERAYAGSRPWFSSLKRRQKNGEKAAEKKKLLEHYESMQASMTLPDTTVKWRVPL